MRRSLLFILVLLGVFSTAAACPVTPRAPAPHVHSLTPAPIPPSSEADQIISLVNEQRVASGCPALTLDGSMTAFAQSQSDWMANGGGLVHSRLGEPIFAENLSQGYTVPQEIVDAWLDSSAHKENIFNCSYTETGAAITGDFAVQVFGNAA